MALSRSEINQRSNEKRGVVNKGFKLNQDIVDQIIALAQQEGLSQSQFITKLIKDYQKQKSH
jgi:predicted DNA-binding ribbon-helix-helix protein